jgi:hypothetical protein
MWLKMHNRTLLSAIHNIYNKKNLNGTFIKVKGHSNIIGNDIADTQAKIGADAASIHHDRIIDIDFSFRFINSVANDLSYSLYWRGFVIDRNVRNFFKNANIIHNATDWAMNRHNRNVTLNATDGHLYWKCTWNFFHSLRKHCTSTKASHSFINTIKITQNGLPTIPFMQHYFPSAYANLLCLFCNQSSESIPHLNQCSHTNTIWKDIELECAATLADYAKQHWNLTLSLHHINSIFFNYQAPELLASKEATRTNYLHGIIDNCTWLNIKKASKSVAVASNLANKFLGILMTKWHSLLWSVRCNKMAL